MRGAPMAPTATTIDTTATMASRRRLAIKPNFMTQTCALAHALPCLPRGLGLAHLGSVLSRTAPHRRFRASVVAHWSKMDRRLRSKLRPCHDRATPHRRLRSAHQPEIDWRGIDDPRRCRHVAMDVPVRMLGMSCLRGRNSARYQRQDNEQTDCDARGSFCREACSGDRAHWLGHIGLFGPP